MGKTCVCGADAIEVNTHTRAFTVDGVTVKEGEVISIDGTSGRVYPGEIPVRPSAVVQYFEGEIREDTDPLIAAVHRLLSHADSARRLHVRTNADTPDDAARARRFGAEGIGLCRTEHMFLGDRRELVERLILATTTAERQTVLDALLPLQREDFVGIFQAMNGLPVTVRLIDPPLHEFLPSLEELAAKVAVAEATGHDPGHDGVLLAAVRRMHEQNPMLGLRGVRLGSRPAGPRSRPRAPTHGEAQAGERGGARMPRVNTGGYRICSADLDRLAPFDPRDRQARRVDSGRPRCVGVSQSIVD
jgi:pyruvate,orthophosphate dikinase